MSDETGRWVYPEDCDFISFKYATFYPADNRNNNNNNDNNDNNDSNENNSDTNNDNMHDNDNNDDTFTSDIEDDGVLGEGAGAEGTTGRDDGGGEGQGQHDEERRLQIDETHPDTEPQHVPNEDTQPGQCSFTLCFSLSTNLK